MTRLGTGPLTFAFADTSVERYLIASSARGIVWLAPAPRDDDALASLARAFPRAELALGEPKGLAAALTLIEDPASRRRPPLDLRGTPFQVSVWEALLRIPAGSTRSYGEIARDIGRPTAVRAVAQACGANPVGVVVPCHRVIGSDGSLTGYAGGLSRKRTLLEREGALPARAQARA